MSGNHTQGLAAAKTNIKRHGKNFYSEIGRKGGLAKKTKPAGFAAISREQLIKVSSKGGKTSKRGKAK